jgi:hypothetical protein
MLFTFAFAALITGILLVSCQLDVMWRRYNKREDLWMEVFMLAGLLSSILISGKTLLGLISG